MHTRSKKKLFWVGFVTMMAWAVTATAQDKPADNMQLTEGEVKEFWPVYDQYQDELFLVRARTLKLINDFRDAYEKKMVDDVAGQLA
ncbi:MAG: hypothetical protein MRJ65_00035 [Candidatus Brocadiaceae bacterium]|nr:hypothetical protein [Candidatus Brocadiaceae bacterium]